MARSAPESDVVLKVQEAGFEPANRYGLGPHPSAFDQAGRLLRAGRRSVLLYLNTPTREFGAGKAHSDSLCPGVE